MNNYLQDIEKAKEILGNDILECLKNIFIHLDGEPPRVEKKRYRANNPKHMALLDTLEHEYQFIYIERIENKDFYLLKSYALPLIETNKSKTLLQAMSEIYSLLPALYSERLDESISVEELFAISNLKKDIFLEALFYLGGFHNIHTGLSTSFPYKKGSSFQISEKVLLKEFLQTVTDYYRWNILNDGKANFLNSIELNQIDNLEPQNNKVGRPNSEQDLNNAYDLLKNRNKINYNGSLKEHVGIIQKTVKIVRQSNNSAGANYKTICKYLSKRFNKDKQSIN